MQTTLNKIRAHRPCEFGWKKLLAHLGKTKADDEPLNIAVVVESIGIDDAIWCLRAVEGHDREIRLFAVWCARQVQHLMADPCSIAAIDVAERFASGEASAEELDAAQEAARAAAWDAAEAAWDAAEAAARAAARDAARAAAEAARAAAEAARAAAEAAQKTKLLEICNGGPL
jgi:hypothetical protein